MSENNVTFKLKESLHSDQLAIKLGSGRGRFIQFWDNPGIPADWEPPLRFLLNHKDIGFFTGDSIVISDIKVLTDDPELLKLIKEVAVQI